MESAPLIASVAHRLGLTLLSDDRGMILERASFRVVFPPDAGASFQELNDLTWALLGVRLAIDNLTPEPPSRRESSPMGFRRTNLRRYHEAPSVHGDHLLFLVPSLTSQVFEHLTGATPLRRPWILPGLEILLLHEEGLKLSILTEEKHQISESTQHLETRWEKARMALFYEAYKLKPREKTDLPDGILKLYSSTEGMMASRSLLLPELDYDTAQDQGYFSIPTRDTLLIAAPAASDPSPDLLASIQKKTSSLSAGDPFRLTDAILQLSRNDIQVASPPTFQVGASVEDDFPPTLRLHRQPRA